MAMMNCKTIRDISCFYQKGVKDAWGPPREELFCTRGMKQAIQSFKLFTRGVKT